LMSTDRISNKLSDSKPITANDFMATGNRWTNNPGTQDLMGNTNAKSTKAGPDVWVKKWVDYSSKYGLGYLLSNNATGVFFNDSTKIILDPKGHHFDYMERRTTDK
jgi:polo-like kinase 1